MLKIGSEEFTEFADLYDRPDFLSQSEKEDIGRFVKDVGEALDRTPNPNKTVE